MMCVDDAGVVQQVSTLTLDRGDAALNHVGAVGDPQRSGSGN